MREHPQPRAALHHHDVEAALPVGHAPAEHGELELTLADADEHERRAEDSRAPVDLDLHAHASHGRQATRECGDGDAMPIAEVPLEPLARANEAYVSANAARVEEDAAVHHADVHSRRARVRRELNRLGRHGADARGRARSG